MLGQASVDPVRGLCNSQLMCRECILANPNCVWCADMVSLEDVKKRVWLSYVGCFFCLGGRGGPGGEIKRSDLTN